jgi:hypothetical protein
LECNSDTEKITEVRVLRNQFKIEMLDNTPFGDMIFNRVDAYMVNLREPETATKYAMFRKLAGHGNAQSLGVHTIRGFENGIDLFTYPL